jgi:plasmid maintenance system killer protein
MALIQKKTEAERAQKAEAKEQTRLQAEERKRLEQIEKARNAFMSSPVGLARLAFKNGDHVFQYSIDVMNQQAIIIAMVGSTTSSKKADPTSVLSAVCHEGWELVNGSFVFVEQGQQSRDKFLASGQNVAIKGTTVGYYLFKRCEANQKQPLPEPWKEVDASGYVPASTALSQAARRA